MKTKQSEAATFLIKWAADNFIKAKFEYDKARTDEHARQHAHKEWTEDPDNDFSWSPDGEQAKARLAHCIERTKKDFEFWGDIQDFIVNRICFLIDEADRSKPEGGEG